MINCQADVKIRLPAATKCVTYLLQNPKQVTR